MLNTVKQVKFVQKSSSTGLLNEPCTGMHVDIFVVLLTSTVPGAASTLNPGYSIILLRSYVSETNSYHRNKTHYYLQASTITTSIILTSLD